MAQATVAALATLVVSDLHLGASSNADLLRRADVRARLMAALRDGIERLVILGDALELREVAVRDAAAQGRPLLEEAGEALGPGGEIVLLGGNHDHALLAGWTEAHLMQAPPHTMPLAQAIAPHDAGPLGEALAAAAKPATLSFAYPGIWLREDVYAIHGHYLDVHTQVPTIERLAAGAMQRFISPLPAGGGATPDDYEAVLAPLYSWMFALAQRSRDGVVRAGARSSARAWVSLTGRPEGVLGHARALATRGAFATAVAGVNAAGLGPVKAQLSGAALRRGSLWGMGEALRRLGVDAEHVVFGHTHRSGPWPGDDPAEWRAPTGARLVNTGSWVYQAHFLTPTPNESPYWPGTAVRLNASGPPQLVRLLGDDLGHDELRPPAPGRG
ncbi:MAG: hypothetical protein QOE86_2661 [Solirubrobacteraceae bacterium]|nr:hypothetical protein [Solirubrobacteraceae bacterium]